MYVTYITEKYKFNKAQLRGAAHILFIVFSLIMMMFNWMLSAYVCVDFVHFVYSFKLSKIVQDRLPEISEWEREGTIAAGWRRCR